MTKPDPFRYPVSIRTGTLNLVFVDEVYWSKIGDCEKLFWLGVGIFHVRRYGLKIPVREFVKYHDKEFVKKYGYLLEISLPPHPFEVRK